MTYVVLNSFLHFISVNLLYEIIKPIMVAQLMYYLYLRDIPISRNLQLIFSKEPQMIDYNLVDNKHFELNHEVATLQVINFYLISLDEIVAVALVPISLLLFLIQRRKLV